MAFAALTPIATANFKATLLNYLKTVENQQLVGKTAPTSWGGIHNDSKYIPTVGFGLNLKALTADQIGKAFALGLTGSVTGALTAQQKAGINIVLKWKATETPVPSGAAPHADDKLLINKSMQLAGTAAEKAALKSLWMTDAQATRVLDAFVYGKAGLFNGPSMEAGLSAKLAKYGATIPAASYEKLVLMSLYYNGPGLIGAGISNAIKTGNHAAFWYEVRYNHSGYTSAGLQNRREKESNFVGILAPAERADVGKVLVAMDYLFDRTGGTASVYEKIAARDAAINAGDSAQKATQSFAAQIAPYITLLSKTYAFNQRIDFVQWGGAANEAIVAGVAKHAGLNVNNTNDLMFGMVGNDTITAGGGNDHAYGGVGNDRIFGDLDLSAYKPGTLTVVLPAGVPAIVVDGQTLNLPAALAVLQQADGGLKVASTVTGADKLYGDDGNDLLFGAGGNDTLTGGNHNDTLLGGVGVDSIVGGSGNDYLGGGKDTDADVLAGGLGNDVYLAYAGDKIVEAKNQGLDTVLLGASGTYAVNNVELVALTSGAANVNLKLTSMGQLHPTLQVNFGLIGNAANNVVTFDYAATEQVFAAFFGGGGNDTFKFTSTGSMAPYMEGYFQDFGPGDKIDLSALDLDAQIASGRVIDMEAGTGWEDGFYLVSKQVSARILNGYDGSTPLYVNKTAAQAFGTDANWMVVEVQGSLFNLKVEFYGSMAAGDFIV